MGTETGNSYSINNSAEKPHVPISQLTKDTVPSNGILLDPSEKEVLPMAFWKCTLADTPEKCMVDTDWARGGNPNRMCTNWVAKKPAKRCKKKNARECCGSICFPRICDWRCRDKKKETKVSDSIGKLSCEDIAKGGYCNRKNDNGFKMTDYCPTSCDSCEHQFDFVLD